ncbi:MAG: flavodoxin family protein [Spirochaetes bacterium]|nr:flavodoxin family protein [Spirochaetota bacterium]
MKVVAFNGSPRKQGNTSILIKKVFAGLEAAGIECELVHIGGKPVRGCTACGKCRERRDRRCSIDTDIVNECIEKMLAADGIIIGSPTYFAGVTAETKALIDRSGYVARGNDNMFRRKLGASVSAVRRAGSLHVFDTINAFFLINEMIVPGSVYWNMAVGREIGDVESDEEGMRTMEVLGINMAWLLGKIHA